MQLASHKVAEYFPTKETDKEEFQKKADSLSRNEWQVINCHIDELSTKLKSLGPGRKQLDVARFEDQVTVVVNHLDVLY
jgi:hypothetical protein